jgi:hypothetical protein
MERARSTPPRPGSYGPEPFVRVVAQLDHPLSGWYVFRRSLGFERGVRGTHLDREVVMSTTEVDEAKREES